MKYLIGMDGLMSVEVDVRQTDIKIDVYERWNRMRLNLIWNDVVLATCKTTAAETNDDEEFCYKRRNLLLLFWKSKAEMKMERDCRTTETNDAASHCWNH